MSPIKCWPHIGQIMVMDCIRPSGGSFPELLELNGTAPAPVQLRMVSERCERIAIWPHIGQIMVMDCIRPSGGSWGPSGGTSAGVVSLPSCGAGVSCGGSGA